MDKAAQWVPVCVIAILAAMFIQLFLSRSVKENLTVTENHRWHVQIISNDTDTFFHSQFVMGAEEAAQELNMLVEFVGADKWEPDALYSDVLTAIYAGVDMAAFQLNDPKTMLELYKKAQEEGVELILYESENYQQISIPSVGSNSYDIGAEAGRLALAATDGNCKAVLILDKTEENVPSAHQNMKIQAITEALSRRPGNGVVATFYLDGSMIAGEYLVNTIIEQRDDFNTIICLHEKTTPLMAQRLIDNNLVDSVTLVGCGALPQTLEYIERDVIFGTICPDAYGVGYNTVSLMYAKLNREKIRDHSSTRLFTITKENVNQFKGPLEKAG